MLRTKYYLNTETLRFEKVRHPLRKKLLNTSFYFVILLIIASGLRLGFDKIAESPKVVIYTEKNKELKSAYDFLMNEISRAEGLLTDLQERDVRLYRSILELNPIPQSIREAGFGGSENYRDFLMSRSDEKVVTTARQLEKLFTKVKIQSISLNDITDIAKMQKALIAGRPSLHPISPAETVWLSSSFGYRFDPFHRGRRMHQGIDLAGNPGIKIYASGDGKVVDAAMSRQGYGREVYIDHGFGYTSRYAHLLKIHVKSGQQVKRGQLIGELGNTGRSTGPHLHYEVRLHDKALNPMYFFFENLTASEYSEIIAQVSN
jgi:murein DD-endopeptidase MepM/ murein hydrolase activator NlpD